MSHERLRRSQTAATDYLFFEAFLVTAFLSAIAAWAAASRATDTRKGE